MLNPIQTSTFLQQLDSATRERLHDRLHRTNHLIKTHGIKYFSDAGELLTGYAYGEFYDWDLYFENIYLSYFGVPNYCRSNLEAFLDRQLPNGFVSRTLNIVHSRPTDHFKPFLAQIAVLGSRQTGRYNWLIGRYYDRLVKYLDHWSWYKDHDRNGLAVWQGAGHSGMDNQWSRCGEDDAETNEGVDLNCYLVMEYRALAIIADQIGKPEDAERFRRREQEIKDAINRYLWHAEDQFYYDRNERTGQLVPVQSVAAFIPLWAGVASPEQARALVERHLTNPDTFWLDYPVATYSKQEPDYYQSITGEECNWRGPAWIPTNYMICHGLNNYGFGDLARELARRSFDMVLGQEETREYYNAETGNGEGLFPFWGWSTLAYFMPLELELGYDPTRLDGPVRDIGREYFGISFDLY